MKSWEDNIKTNFGEYCFEFVNWAQLDGDRILWLLGFLKGPKSLYKLTDRKSIQAYNSSAI
jgi:hypothetical protein